VSLIVRFIIRRVGIPFVASGSGQALHLRGNLSAALFGKFHNQGKVFAGAAGGSLIPLLTENHIFRSESTDFDEELPGRAALGSSIKQAAIRASAPLPGARRWSNIFFTPLFDSPIFAASTFWSIPLRVPDALIVLCPHG
jgi:hypothetical protein